MIDGMHAWNGKAMRCDAKRSDAWVVIVITSIFPYVLRLGKAFGR